MEVIAKRRLDCVSEAFSGRRERNLLSAVDIRHYGVMMTEGEDARQRGSDSALFLGLGPRSSGPIPPSERLEGCRSHLNSVLSAIYCHLDMCATQLSPLTPNSCF